MGFWTGCFNGQRMQSVCVGEGRWGPVGSLQQVHCLEDGERFLADAHRSEYKFQLSIN